MEPQPVPSQPTTPFPSSPPPQPTIDPRRTNVYLICCGVIIVVVLSIVGYFIMRNIKSNRVIPKPTESSSNPEPLIIYSPSPLTDSTVNWKTYKNDTYHFEYKYPPNWVFTSNMANSILSWANKEFASLEIKNLYTHRSGNPQTEETSTTITSSVFTNSSHLSLNELLYSYLPELSKVTKGELIDALKKANHQETGLLTYNQSVNGDVETYEFGAVIMSGYFQYAKFFRKTNSDYAYSIELNLPLRLPPKVAQDKDEEFTDIYSQILSSFKFTNPVVEKRKECPDAWVNIVSQIPVVNNPYYGKIGQFMTVKGSIEMLPAENFDIQWIEANCVVNKPEPVG